MSALTLEHTAKAHGFNRMGIHATMSTGRHRFLCEIWGDDFKFVSEYGGTEHAAINRAVKAAKAKARKVVAEQVPA